MSKHQTSATEVVMYQVRGYVGVITLNRPEARNAVNGAIARRLDELLAKTEADDAIRAVVITSSLENVFCAGADLAEISRGNGATLSTERGGFAGITRARRAKPWIAAISGAAVAGGCEIALSCDMIVAGRQAWFGLSEVKRGLFAGAGGPLRLQRALPRNIALELVATGDGIEAERAYQLGMVNRLVDDAASVLPAALELANTIAANAPLSVRESLAITRAAADMDEDDYWAASAKTSALVFCGEDAREGPRAFLEKREPHWTGR